MANKLCYGHNKILPSNKSGTTSKCNHVGESQKHHAE